MHAKATSTFKLIKPLPRDAMMSVLYVCLSVCHKPIFDHSDRALNHTISAGWQLANAWQESWWKCMWSPTTWRPMRLYRFFGYLQSTFQMAWRSVQPFLQGSRCVVVTAAYFTMGSPPAEVPPFVQQRRRLRNIGDSRLYLPCYTCTLRPKKQTTPWVKKTRHHNIVRTFAKCLLG